MTDTDHRPQLQAVDAGTEVQLDEGRVPGPAYVDITSGEAQRRAIIPEHWRTLEAAKRHVQLAAARHGHRAAYHGVRSPGYGALAAGYAVRGRVRHPAAILRWWHIPGTSELEHQAAADGLLNDHLRLHKQGRDTRKARGIILAVCAVVVLVAVRRHGAVRAVVGCGRSSPRAAFTALARAGRPQGKTITNQRGAARAGAAAGPGRDRPGARVAGHRARSTRRSPRARSRRSRRRSARTAPAGGPRSTCRTASPPRRSSSGASSSRPACAARSARCGRSRSPASTPGAWSCGSAARTCRRRSPRRGRGCAPAAATCSRRSRSAPTRAAAASTAT